MVFVRSLIVVALLSLVWATTAHGDYLYDWDSTSPVFVDGENLEVGPGQDILQVWHAFDGTDHYFRMDLRGKPTTGDSAGIYGIYFDSKPGGGNNTDQIQYIPDSLTEINYILDSHFEETDVYFRHDYHKWSPYGGWVFRALESGEHQESENGGATLEWKIPAVEEGEGIGEEFTWWASGIVPGFPSTVYDITDPIVFPEPATALLVLIVTGGCMLRRRR